MAALPDTSSSPDAPQHRLAAIIDALCRTMAADSHARGLAGPLVLLIFTRLRRLAARFATALAHDPAPERTRPARPHNPAPKQATILPRNFGWLRRILPGTAAAASQLNALLADPEMTALIAAHPTTGRALRPLCHLLGIRRPQALHLPKRAAPAAPDPRPAPKPKRAKHPKTTHAFAWLTGPATVTPTHRRLSFRP